MGSHHTAKGWMQSFRSLSLTLRGAEPEWIDSHFFYPFPKSPLVRESQGKTDTEVTLLWTSRLHFNVSVSWVAVVTKIKQNRSCVLDSEHVQTWDAVRVILRGLQPAVPLELPCAGQTATRKGAALGPRTSPCREGPVPLIHCFVLQRQSLNTTESHRKVITLPPIRS